MTDRIIALCILCLVFGLPLGVAAVFTGELILDFVFLAAVYVSVVDHRGLYFWFQLERHWPWGGYPAADAAGQSTDLDPDPLL